MLVVKKEIEQANEVRRVQVGPFRGKKNQPKQSAACMLLQAQKPRAFLTAQRRFVSLLAHHCFTITTEVEQTQALHSMSSNI